MGGELNTFVYDIRTSVLFVFTPEIQKRIIPQF